MVATMRTLGENDVVMAYATSPVTGTVTYLEQIPLSPGAAIEVKLVDVSRAEAPAIVVAEQVIDAPGQVPVGFEVVYDPAKIAPLASRTRYR